MSGLSHTPGKRAKGKTFRGFESRLLRHLMSIEIFGHPTTKRFRFVSLGKYAQISIDIFVHPASIMVLCYGIEHTIPLNTAWHSLSKRL